jgi:hypothetical protein
MQIVLIDRDVAWIAGPFSSRQPSCLLYGVSSTDRVAMAVAGGLSTCATLLPARRAVRIDPAVPSETR